MGSRVNQFEAGDSGSDFKDLCFYISYISSSLSVWGALPISSSGSLCEFIVVDSRSVRLKPHLLDHLGAATLPFSSLQVYGMVSESLYLYLK